jgi:hypothetical protein
MDPGAVSAAPNERTRALAQGQHPGSLTTGPDTDSRLA